MPALFRSFILPLYFCSLGRWWPCRWHVNYCKPIIHLTLPPHSSLFFVSLTNKLVFCCVGWNWPVHMWRCFQYLMSWRQWHWVLFCCCHKFAAKLFLLCSKSSCDKEKLKSEYGEYEFSEFSLERNKHQIQSYICCLWVTSFQVRILSENEFVFFFAYYLFNSRLKQPIFMCHTCRRT